MSFLKENKAWLSMSVLMAFLVQLTSPFIAEVQASEPEQTNAELVYNGTASYSGSTVGDFTMYDDVYAPNGKQAFCVEHDNATPPSGSPIEDGRPYNDQEIKVVLYYGWDGPESIFGDSSSRRDEGIVCTSLALSDLFGTSDPSGGDSYWGKQELIRLANDPNTYVPDDSLGFSDTNLTTSVSGNVQKSQTTKFESDPKNTVSFTIPSKVTFKNVTTGATKTGGTVTVKGGDSFYFTAPLDYGTDYNSGTLHGSMDAYSPILYSTPSSGTQEIMHGAFYDPTETCSFSVDFKQFTGDATVTKQGTDGDYLAGATYEIEDSSGNVDATVTTGSNGKATANDLIVGTYTVTEIEAPEGYTINTTPKTITVSAGQNTNVTFTNQEVFFEVEIIKNDDYTGDTAQGDATFEGAEYGVYADQSCTQLLDSVTLDENGHGKSEQISFEGESSRTVYIKEITPPEGYNLSSTVYPVTVNQTDDTTEVFITEETVEDNVIDGDVNIQKYFDDSEGSGELVPEEGAEFTLTFNSDPSVQYVEVTDENGFAEFRNIPYGEYTLSQTDAPPGTDMITETYQVVIDSESEEIQYVFTNNALKVPVKITKLDEETGKPVLVAGTTFKVKDMQTDEWISDPSGENEFVTNDQGYVVLPVELPQGDYELYEVTAPNGYVGNSTPVPFTVNEQTSATGIVEVNVYNEAQKGTIQVNKTGEEVQYGDNGELEYVQVPLEGAVFEITAKGDIYTGDGTLQYTAGEVVDTITTDENGHAESTELHLGTYTVTEIDAPYGYKLADPIDATLEYDGQDITVMTTSVDVENKLKKYNTELIKQDVESGEVVAVEGTQFQIYDADNNQLISLYNSETKEWEDTFTTDERGVVELPQKLPIGDYYMIEIHAPEGYVVDSTPVPFTISEDSENPVKVVNSNVAQKGTIEINKTGEDVEYGNNGELEYVQVPLEGAVFEITAKEDIYTPDGTLHYAKGEVVDTITTDANGHAESKELYLGTYVVTEIEAPYGYELLEDPVEVTLDYAGENIDVTSESVSIENTAIKHGVKIVKKDAESERIIPVRFAGFEIYDASTDQKISLYNERTNEWEDTFYTNTRGTVDLPQQLPYGHYYLVEIDAPWGYTLDPTPVYFTVDHTTAPGEMVVVEKYNMAQKGTIEINKTGEIPVYDEDNKLDYIQVPLEDATFEIAAKEDIRTPDGTLRYAEGEVVDTITTDASGYAKSIPLYLGTYTVTEIDSPYGYGITEPVDVTLEYAGQNVDITSESVSISNDLIKTPVEIVKKDVETGVTVPIEGVGFKIVDVDTDEYVSLYSTEHGKWVNTFYTNEDGIATLPQPLPYGDYAVVEVFAPEGYVLDSTPVPFTIDENSGRLVTVDVMNEAQKGIVEIEKTGEEVYYPKDNQLEYKQVPLEGAVFEIAAAEDIYTPEGTLRYAEGEVVDTVTTDANGHAESKELYLGTYTITEIEAPYGYVLLDKPVNVTLEYAGQEIVVTSKTSHIENFLIKVPVEIVKKDVETGVTVPVEGTGFKIVDVDTNKPVALYNSETRKWEEVFYTNEDGVATLPQPLPYGDYVAIEVSAPEGYVLDSTPVPFTIDENSGRLATVEVMNEAQKGVVTIEKTGQKPVGTIEKDTEYGTDYDFVFEQKPLADVTFGIYAAEAIVTPEGTVRYEKGEKVDTITTKEDGKASSKELYLGKYYAVEESAPSGYVIDSTPIYFELAYAGQEVPLTFETVTLQNELQDLIIKTHKVEEVVSYDEEGNAVIETVPSNDKVFGVFLAEDMALEYSKTKEVIPEGSMVATATTVDGIATVTEKLPEGSYYIQELNSGENHILDTNKYYFEYTATDNNETLVIDVYGNEINNDLPTTPSSPTVGNPIANAPTIEQPIADQPSTEPPTVENPIVIPEELGQPIVNELATFEFTIQKMNEVMDTYGEEWTSHYEPTGEGAEFGLYNEDQLVQTITIGEDSTATVGPLYAGQTYTLKELKTSSDEYRITDEVWTIAVDNTGYVITDSEGNVVDLENETLVVENNLKRGIAEISKKDITGQEELEGATLNLKGVTYPSINITWISDGTTKEFWLPEGTYELTETIPNEGYQLNTETITFEVKDGEATKVTMHNTPVEHEKLMIVPKTGDDSHVFLWFVLIGAVGMTVYVMNRKKTKNVELK